MNDPRDGGMALAEAVGNVSQMLAVGQKRRAREMAVALVARAPDEPGAHVVLSQVLLALGEIEPALAAADESVRLAPDDDRGHGQRARALFRRGRFAAAERAVQEALALDSADAGYHLLRARVLASCGRHGPGLDATEESLTLDPDNPETHQIRAWLLLRTKPRDWRLSEATARRAVELDPDDASGHAVLGFALLQSHRFREAEERFRAALVLDPTSALALKGLAEVVMSRSIFYRPFLRFSLFLQSAGVGAQLGVIAGLWALVNAAVPLLRAGPSPLPVLARPLETAYLVFCGYTWFITPVTRFILARQYPWLRELGE